MDGGDGTLSMRGNDGLRGRIWGKGYRNVGLEEHEVVEPQAH